MKSDDVSGEYRGIHVYTISSFGFISAHFRTFSAFTDVSFINLCYVLVLEQSYS